MAQREVDVDTLAELLKHEPGDLCDLVMELRELVLAAAPEATETIRWNSLFYYKAYEGGVIRGAVCCVGIKNDCVQLGFVHGAFLPDPEGLLSGEGKAKRQIELRSFKDIRRAAFKKLIREAVAYQPG
jgi:hypothetical protein